MKDLKAASLICICVLSLTACDVNRLTEQDIPPQYRYENEAAIKEPTAQAANLTVAETTVPTPESLEYILPKMRAIPDLPESDNDITDFVPEGWTLLDSVELDYNGDGYTDFVGVLERPDDGNIWYPRILFSIYAVDKGSRYKLEFQDINAVRGSNDGGIYGDPYMGLSADGNTFTTHAYGGSGWRWSEDITYKYTNGQWLVKSAEYNDYWIDELCSYKLDDYETGVGKRMDSNNYDKPPKHEVKYEVPLDPPPTLHEYNINKNKDTYAWLGSENLEVNSIILAEGIDCNPNNVPPPSVMTDFKTGSSIIFSNSDYILYEFNDILGTSVYLGIYDCHSQDVYVIDCGEYYFYHNFFSRAEIYNDKIFYPCEIWKSVKIKLGDVTIYESNKRVVLQLYRMDFDGRNKKLIFEYESKAEEIKTALLDIHPSYLFYEIMGGQIIVKVCDKEVNLFYRMDLDGGNIEYIDSLAAYQY